MLGQLVGEDKDHGTQDLEGTFSFVIDEHEDQDFFLPVWEQMQKEQLTTVKRNCKIKFEAVTQETGKRKLVLRFYEIGKSGI